jgi:predicted AlkP superfamily pyrophosphatase or phosphodiesterase
MNFHYRIILLLLLYTGTLQAGQTTVFIVSMDGIRPDYVTRAQTPFLDTIQEKGAFSLDVMTTFPTITFQMHSSMATGTKGRVHGIVANSFYDTRTQTLHRYAGDYALMEAEAIWETATRQGVRVSVLDWVKAHNQQGPNAAAIFGPSYTRGISDEERIDRALDTWEADTHETPLRLIMAYGESPDKEGHRYGPDAPELEETMTSIDAYLAGVYYRAQSLWRRTAGTEDSFVFMIVSDHGMAPAHTAVNLGLATGISREDTAHFVTTSNIGHIFFDRFEDPTEREAAMEAVLEKLAGHDFISAWRRHDLPPEWQYDHPYRSGDVVVVMPSGYVFSGRARDVAVPVADVGGPFGMHGYDPRKDPTMKTVFFAHRYPAPYGGLNLGRISTLQLHATLAHLLGIEPASTAFSVPVFGVDP